MNLKTPKSESKVVKGEEKDFDTDIETTKVEVKTPKSDARPLKTEDSEDKRDKTGRDK